MNRCKTIILFVIGTPVFIEQYIPIGPTNSSVIKVVNHASAITFTQFPSCYTINIERPIAALRKDQVLVWKCLVDPRKIIKHLAPSTPVFIPMEPNSPNIFPRLRIRQDGGSALIYQITVMVPHYNFLTTQALFGKCRAKKILQKITLFFRRINTGLPFLSGHRLILNACFPNRYTFRLIGINKFGIIICPGLVKLGL